jgi:DNA-binding SARP family transcriptional activator
MARWAVSLLGAATAAWTPSGLASIPGAAWPLVGFLACQRGGRAPRGRIAAALWPDRDEEAGRHCLATTLWRLKRTVSGGRPLIDSETDPVGLLGTPWIDMVAFQTRVEDVLRRVTHPERGDARRLRTALALYRGPFLDGLFSDWALLERERLACLHLDGLHALAQIEASSGNWTESMRASQLLCRLEPLREDGHRLLMRAYAETGNRALALRQYRICAEVLEKELGVGPMAETTALESSLSGTSARSAPCALVKDTLVQARDHLVAALDAVDHALNKSSSEMHR